jgi:exosortase A
MATEAAPGSDQVQTQSARPESSPAASPDRHWRSAALWFALAIAGLLTVYMPTVKAMERIWTYNKSYAHCFFIAPLAAYMVWLNRHRLAALTPRPSPWGIGAVLAFGGAWYVAHVGAIQVGEHLSLVAMAISLVWAVLGERALRLLAFPLGFLFLLVPFGEGLFPILISIAGKMAVSVLHVMGTPVAFDGYYLRVENGEWRITEACSGLRFILSIITVGAVYSYTSYSRWWKRVAFLASSVLAALIMNAFRVWLLVMIGMYSNMKAPLVRNHVPLGWAIFAVMVLVIFALGRLWMDPDAVGERPLPPERMTRAEAPRGRATFAGAAVLALALAAAWPLLVGAIERPRTGEPPIVLVAPADGGGWVSIPSMPWDWEPHYAGAKATVRHAYQGGPGPIGLYAAFFRDQRQGAELVRVENGLPTPGDPTWRYTPEVRRTLPGLDITIEEVDARSGALGFRAWRWYWVRGRNTPDASAVKIAGLVGKLLGRGDDAAVIVVYAPFDQKADAATPALTSFLKDMKPRIDQMVTGAAGGH